MPGPWEKYQNASESGPWQKYAPRDDSATAAPPVAAHPAVDMKAPESFGGTYLKRLGDNVSGLLKPLMHPIDSMMSHPDYAKPWESGDLISDIRENPNSTGVANALADTTTALAIGGAAHFAPKVLTPLGERMKSSGAKLIDRTAGLRKADVARGAEPGRAYLEGGGGPALTLKGLGESARKIMSNAGTNLGDAYKNSTAIIPASDVLQAVQEPISKLKNLQNSPGGTGTSANIADFESNLTQPVFNASSRGGFTPSELFTEMKQPISQNTRWNDPTMYDLNKVRQETVGKIGDLLTASVPETGPLNKIYQGNSKLAARAEERAATGQSPLSDIGRKVIEGAGGAVLGSVTGHPLLTALPLVADSVPARTSVAKGLFEGGKVAAPLGRGLRGIAPLTSTSGTGGPKKRPKDDQSNKN